MNANATALLADPHPGGHIVYPYTDENLVSQAVCLFASAGIRNGEGVILIMAKAHRDPIKRRLEAEGFEVAVLERAGKLVCLVAEDLLPAFIVDGHPDGVLFKTIVGTVIRRVRASTSNGHPSKVRVFGEMVSLLWKTNLDAATQLEELWNELLREYSISLMCTYELCDAPHDALPSTLLDLHSHNLTS